MKFSKSGHALLAASVSLGIALGITSCGESNTIDYVFVTASKNNPGQVAVYRVDLQSGALTQIPDSPYGSGGRNPVGEVTSPNGNNLYVINHDDNTVVEFAIGSDGKLYPQHTYNTPGTEPQSIAINAAGTLLFVVDTYQAGFSDANPGPGALVVFPVASDGSLGTQVANGNLPYWPVQYSPSTVNVLANGNFVYVANANTNNPVAANQQGIVTGFSVASGGVLTPLAATVYAGITPTASASDPTSRFLYVTDAASNQVYAYGILAGGALIPLQNGPFKTDVYPDAVTVDRTGMFLYIANYNSNDISGYAIDQGTGAPSSLAGAGTYATKTGPTCVLVEPAFGKYVYTTNFLDNSLTGYQLNINNGALTGTENSPYPTSAFQPTCAAAVTHGNHPGEHVQATAGS
jgi:6-phosphogluconolactonase